MKVVPQAGTLTAPYWNALKEHRIVVQQCGHCGAVQHPPLPVCSRCHHGELGWMDIDPVGTVYSYAIVHQATHAAFAADVPYAVGLVELAPGVRLIARLEGDFAHLRIGMRVQGEYRDISAEVTLVHFVPQTT